MESPESFVIRSSCGGYTRKAWLLRGRGADSGRVIVFLDAEHYLRDLDCLPVIRELRELESMTCVFVSHESGAARHLDYTCNEAYGGFIAEDGRAGGLEERRALGLRIELERAGECIFLFAVPGSVRRGGVPIGVILVDGAEWSRDFADECAVLAECWRSGNRNGVSHPPSGMRQEISQIEGCVS